MIRLQMLLPFRAIFCAILSLIGLAEVDAEAWSVERHWNEEEEGRFSTWTARVGQKEWRSVNHVLRDPEFNSLFDAADKDLYLYADCADLPLILRAYYSYKRNLPFVVNRIQGGRYTSRPNHTEATFDNLSFTGSAQQFFEFIAETVHTGNYRTSPEATDSITYPIALKADFLRPGAIFYSPEGHVAMVAEVKLDGSVFLIDAHPDQTITRIRFSPKLLWQSGSQVGGFKAFRTAELKQGTVRWVTDSARLAGFSTDQFKLGDGYYEAVRQQLSKVKVDPREAFQNYLREDLLGEILDRVKSVDLAWAAGRERPIVGGEYNIYDAEGEWEEFSSPSRDLRLRRALLHIPVEIQQLMVLARDYPSMIRGRRQDPVELGNSLLVLKERFFRNTVFHYTNSAGDPVHLTVADVEQRLFRLSFNPNHPPELRWGAEGAELATAPRNEGRFYASYQEEQSWRNRLEKKTGAMSVDDPDNPRQPPPHDISALIQEAIREAENW